jgi:PPM family protein phosphatase
MISFGITDKGKVRSENQDSYIIENCDKRKCVIAVICDGMGGAKAGDIASRLASKEFVSRVFEALAAPRLLVGNQEKLLRDSCADANGVVYEYSRFDAAYDGMGTTLVGGIITSRKAQLINVGDSRAYYLSKSGISQISRDHSYVEELVAMGAITRQEAEHHPKKNIITRALGVDASVEADYYECSLHKGDGILLCSDGLSNMVSDKEIHDYFCEKSSPADVCSGLMELALARRARDNVSIVLIKT